MKVKKRIPAFCLAVIMTFQSVLPCAAAEEEEDVNIAGKISIYSEYSGETEWDAALHNGKLILMTAEDIGTIAGAQDVSWNSSGTVVVIRRGNYCVEVDTDEEEAGLILTGDRYLTDYNAGLGFPVNVTRQEKREECGL